MRKRSLSVRQNLLLIWKLAILLSFIFLVFALVRIHFYYDDRSPDDHADDVFQGNPSLAFMFLVRRDLPLDFLWQTFYQVPSLFTFYYSSLDHRKPNTD
ncbi:putative glycosyltransferase BC10 [Helianthus annuus]|nr:putative glycosyltransferase BC10 [Helianthus annuus]KAJ0745799.1 putative glycosyltransferase BC10 [Helianthus annuus]